MKRSSVSGSSTPLRSTGRYAAGYPLRSIAAQLLSTALCSVMEVSSAMRPELRHFIAQLSLSVPPEVKYISDGSAFMHSAMSCRAFARAALALREKEYGCDALPYSVSRNGFIASNASGASAVVAALSAYIM